MLKGLAIDGEMLDNALSFTQEGHSSQKTQSRITDYICFKNV